MVRHIKNYNLQTFLSFQQPPLLRHKLQFKYHHHQKKHHSAVKKKEKNKQNRKKRRKKKKIETEFQFSFFEAPLVILLRTTTKWLTIACETSVHSLLPTTIIIVKTLWEGHKMGDFFFQIFVAFSEKLIFINHLMALHSNMYLFSLEKNNQTTAEFAKQKQTRSFHTTIKSIFFLSHSLPHFLHKIWSKVAHLNKKKTSET